MTDSEHEERVEFRQIARSYQTFARDRFAERDLDAVYPDFATGNPISWAGVYKIAPPGPSKSSALRGTDWQVYVQLESYEFRERGQDGSEVTRTVDGPVALVSVETGQANLNGARDIGRPRLAALVGYLAIRSQLFVGGTIEWEGAVLGVGDKVRTFSANLRAGLEMSDSRVEELRQQLVRIEIGSLSASHQLALEWITEAWASTSRSLQLANLWFAVVVIVDSGYTRTQRRNTSQMQRVEEHLLQFPISKERRDQLLTGLAHAYQIRNEIVHEGNRSAASIREIEGLWQLVQEFIVTELGRA